VLIAQGLGKKSGGRKSKVRKSVESLLKPRKRKSSDKQDDGDIDNEAVVQLIEPSQAQTSILRIILLLA